MSRSCITACVTELRQSVIHAVVSRSCVTELSTESIVQLDDAINSYHGPVNISPSDKGRESETIAIQVPYNRENVWQ